MKAILAAALFLALPAHSGDRAVPLGTWTGNGVQDGDTWAVELQVVQAGARVDYPDIPCGGLWVFDPDILSVRGTEWLTYGQDLCIDGLTVTLIPEVDGLMVRWFDDDGTEIAHARLSRADLGKTGSGKK